MTVCLVTASQDLPMFYQATKFVAFAACRLSADLHPHLAKDPVPPGRCRCSHKPQWTRFCHPTVRQHFGGRARNFGAMPRHAVHALRTAARSGPRVSFFDHVGQRSGCGFRQRLCADIVRACDSCEPAGFVRLQQLRQRERRWQHGGDVCGAGAGRLRFGHRRQLHRQQVSLAWPDRLMGLTRSTLGRLSSAFDQG